MSEMTDESAVECDNEIFLDEISSEIIDLGFKNGSGDSVSIPLHQFKGSIFHQKCLQVNSQTCDSTGLRLHGGTHVAVRMLYQYLTGESNIGHIFKPNSTVCELGCGTGVFGLLGLSGRSFVSSLTLTDGNAQAVALAKYNYRIWQGMNLFHLPQANFGVLRWDVESDIDEVRNGLNQGRLYDLVLGSELLYYRTDIRELVTTVLRIVDSDGVFIHAHVIRRMNQGNEMELFKNHGWSTMEISQKLFIDDGDREQHPEWFNTRCLVSARNEKMDSLKIIFPEWIDFQEYREE